MYLSNLLLLVSEMAVYFGVMLGLFRARHLVGIGAFYSALGVMYFAAVYLAAGFFLAMPFGLAVSPGSLILYAGPLSLFLLAYIREGEEAARQPLYGFILGTFLLVIMVSILGFEGVRFPAERAADVGFLGQMGALMLWGTLLLFFELLFLFRLFDWLLARLSRNLWLAMWLTLAVTCVFDQAFFFPALNLGFGVPWVVGFGGLLGKLGATAFYSGLIVLYLRYVEGVPVRPTRAALRAVDLGPREDPATGAFHRGRFELLGQDLVGISILTGRPVTLMIVEIEGVNARVLRRAAQTLSEGLRAGDYVVRYEGDTLAVLAPGLPPKDALQVAAILLQRLDPLTGPEGAASVSIGMATAPIDGESLETLLSVADRRGYAARRQGRNRLVGAFES